MSKNVGIGLIGCGAVGSAVARILLERKAALKQRTGFSFELRHVVVRDTGKERDVDLPKAVLTTDPAEMLDDAKVRIVVELAGGVDEAKALVVEALRSGRDVVTANKALLALEGASVFAAARAAGRCVAFEAAVAGGIPLIESVRRGLIANRLDAVYGILNGTCNYVLTRMLENNASYANALSEAQRLGYAEADPTLDVNGTDAAHKLSILATIALRETCPFDRIRVRGIREIELIDLRAGRELGYVCKLLAVARRREDGLDLSVGPRFIHESHPLASVAGPFNAVSVYGDAVGHVLFYGRGAGGMPTASAVVSDVVEVALGNAARTFERIVCLPDQVGDSSHSRSGDVRAPYYIRVGLVDRPGGIGRITTVLGRAGINIAAVVQHDPHPADERVEGAVPVVVTTRATAGQTIRKALTAVEKLDVVAGRPVSIPVLEIPRHDRHLEE